MTRDVKPFEELEEEDKLERYSAAFLRAMQTFERIEARAEWGRKNSSDAAQTEVNCAMIRDYAYNFRISVLADFISAPPAPPSPQPKPPPQPVPMLLWCPECGERHIDEGEFSAKPHHTHSCQRCGMTWRPAIVATVGVQFLPGFKNY